MNVTSKSNPIRQLAALILLLILAYPMCAQEQGDSVVTFRFPTGRDFFYSPGYNNGGELKKLFDFVGRNKEIIMSRHIPLYVDGYCISKGSRAANLAVAKLRSNRVKSELITRKGLKEDCFITHNHAEKGDFVTVRIVMPKDEIQPGAAEERGPEAVVTTVESESVEVQEDESPAVEIEEVELTEEAEVPVNQSAKESVGSRFVIKTNLLDYIVLMPNVEVEWKFVDRWSVAFEWQGAWYSKKDPHKVYRLSTLIPEFRYWPIERSRWQGMYVGLFGGIGKYDLSNGKSNGHEGEGGLVGVSAGYMWRISKHLSLDAGLGVGYLRARDKEYVPRDGHFLYQLTKNINYVGPLRLKLSLVWRIPK